MTQNCFPYLFKEVSEDEYVFLKQRINEILSEVRTDLKFFEGASQEEVEYFDNNKPSIRYNPKRHIVAMQLKEGKLGRLVLSREDIDVMSDTERKIFYALRGRLAEALEGAKIRREEWK